MANARAVMATAICAVLIVGTALIMQVQPNQLVLEQGSETQELAGIGYLNWLKYAGALKGGKKRDADEFMDVGTIKHIGPMTPAATAILKFKKTLKNEKALLSRMHRLMSHRMNGRQPESITVNVGQRGQVGPKGPRGDIGSQGPKGLPGVYGPPGPVGDVGRRGRRGHRGKQGYTGAKGLRGRRGLIGKEGARGKKGLRGDRGRPGYRGIPGGAGAPGPQGRNGPPGKPGPKGSIGREGAPGRQGPRGPNHT